MCGDRRQLNMPDVSRCVSHAAADLRSTSEGAQQCSTAPALGERSSSAKSSQFPEIRAELLEVDLQSASRCSLSGSSRMDFVRIRGA